jgi:hypothetical protein
MWQIIACLSSSIVRHWWWGYLSIDRPRWDDLQDSHIVSLYKTVAKTAADEFSYVFVAYLLGPESTLVSDSHEAGVVRSS